MLKKLGSHLAVIILVFVSQLIYILNSFGQIRYEELSENIRNVYWFSQGLVFSGINTHLGWYAALNLVYKIFGFSFENGQFFRLGLHTLSMYCLYLLLRKYFTFRQLLLPLISFSLAPTLLFFNTLKTHFGVDLQYLPICLYFLASIDFRGKLWAKLGPIILLWALVMFAWLSYPTFIYYLPALLILFIYKMIKARLSTRENITIFVTSLVSFLLPLVLLASQITNRQLLIHDSVTAGGLFQGAGQVGLGNLSLAFQRIWATLMSLASLESSYYYEVNKADFSYLLPYLSIGAGIILATAIFIKRKGYQIVVVSIWSILLLNLAAVAFVADPGGLASVRRATGILFSFYGFYALAWLGLFKFAKINSLKTWILAVILFLLPLHHLLVYPINLKHLAKLSDNREGIWFAGAKTPSIALAKYVSGIVTTDLKLIGVYQNKEDFGITYNWIYSAIKASCYWSNLSCHNIYGYDVAKKDFVILTKENVNYVSKDYQYK